MSAVAAHAKARGLEESAAYWVCAYANNQHELGSDIATDPRQTSFYKAMQLSEGVLVVLDKDATPFTRIWCCFEQAMVAQERYGSWLSRYEDLVEWPRHWGSMLLHTMNMSHPRTVANFDKRLAQYVRDEVRVMPNLSTHVAYLHPGSFLDILDSKVVTELQGRLDAKLKRKSGYWRRRYRL